MIVQGWAEGGDRNWMSSMSKSRDHETLSPETPIYRQSRCRTAADMSLPKSQAGSQDDDEQAQEQADRKAPDSAPLSAGYEECIDYGCPGTIDERAQCK